MRVRAADVASAKPDSPVRLRLAGKVAAGEVFAGEVTAGTCVRLFTGSPLPRRRRRRRDAGRRRASKPNAAGEVLILAPVEPGENVRSRGEDVKRGSTLAEAGELLTAGRIGLLAAAGLTQRPRGTAAGGGFAGNRFGIAGAGPAAGARPDLRKQSHRPGGADWSAPGRFPRTFPLVADELAATSTRPGGRFQPMRCRRDFRRRFGR